MSKNTFSEKDYIEQNEIDGISMEIFKFNLRCENCIHKKAFEKYEAREDTSNEYEDFCVPCGKKIEDNFEENY